MSIKINSIVVSKKKINGEVMVHKKGVRLKVTDIYEDRCTIEEENGSGCIVNVPIIFLKEGKS